MLKCAIIGATGYTGMELTRILARHPSVRLTALTTRQEEAFPVQRLIPQLPADITLEIRKHSLRELKRLSDLAFLCLPHTEAMETAGELRKAGKIVIDLSADFRIRAVQTYERWYGVKHRNPALLKESVYGLPELFRSKIRKADLIANPGCYPTGAALAIMPLLREGLVQEEGIVIDSKSGVSGAGKKLSLSTQFCELEENFYAYRVGRHQHTPEIEQTLSAVAAKPVKVAFTAHLLPVNRGILTTAYMKMKRKASSSRIREAFRKAYGSEPFVRFKPEGEFPTLKDVQHTNYCDIGVHAGDSGRVIVISAIDNLVKGASGQAVQNMNIRMDFPEKEGLERW